MSGFVCHVNERISDAVYIGRPVPRRRLPGSIWGNPYSVDVEGRSNAVARYCDRILYFQRPALLGNLPALRGRPLACWCRRSDQEQPCCHGDVLLALLDRWDDDQLRQIAAAPLAQWLATTASAAGITVWDLNEIRSTIVGAIQ